MKPILLLILIILASSSYAYIDPGTGGMIISGFWQTIVAVVGAVVGFLIINPLKKLFGKFKNGKNK